MVRSHVKATLRRDRRYGVANQRPQRSDDRAERHRAALEAARRADTKERPHPEAEIERAGMHKQSLEHVLVSSGVHASKPTRLVEMRARSFEQFPALAEEP